MALDASLPFGLRAVILRPIASDGTLGTGLKLPNSQVFTFSEAEDYEELRGDDKTVTAHGKGASVEWSLESGGVLPEVWALLTGAALTTSGTTPAQVKTIKKNVNAVRPFFQVEGQSISDSGGDWHTTLHRCRCTDNVEASQEDGKFWISKAGGTAFPSLAAASTDLLYTMIQNETAVSPVTTG